MCYPVKCGSCKLTTWGGCGKHVPSVYQNIPPGQACMCKGWPGVELPTKDSPKDAKTEAKTETTPTATTSK